MGHLRECPAYYIDAITAEVDKMLAEERERAACVSIMEIKALALPEADKIRGEPAEDFDLGWNAACEKIASAIRATLKGI